MPAPDFPTSGQSPHYIEPLTASRQIPTTLNSKSCNSVGPSGFLPYSHLPSSGLRLARKCLPLGLVVAPSFPSES